MFRWLGLLIYFLLIASAWIFRQALFDMVREHYPLISGLVGGLALFVLLVPFIEMGQSRGYARFWRERLEKREALPKVRSWWQRLRHPNDNLSNRLLAPIFLTPLGRGLMSYWADAGFGAHPGIFLTAILFTTLGGYLFGYLSTRSVLLGGFGAFLSLIALAVLTFTRARLHRRRFSDQFPDVLDRLADSLQAGFSLPQAINFVIPNLFEPSASEMAQVSAQIVLGFSVDDALGELYQRRPSEDVRLLVEGLTLQRQVGGDMPAMMRDMASFVRGRVELENEVRTLTSQGRLSAIVIALLVPVSIGVLSMFPGYVDVLFQTTAGNLVLIVAGTLELIGAAIVARLVRIEY
ncbi:MAG: type II secretion system F family protein [Anaerolineales bacterium]|nr:type II secretion system F family protein [Chloroflexota bacterium]MBL6982670.1 type II secretion system F family protein [Anaerolineales bacterium]